MISGFFLSQGIIAPLLRVMVRAPAIRPEWVLATFVIDTGSSATIMHGGDVATLFERDVSRLLAGQPLDSLHGIGGESHYGVVSAEFGFPNDDGSWEVVAGSLRVGVERASPMPAILGWDLLRHFEVALSYERGIVRLTRV